jgi:hypothetical protein
MSQPLYPSGVIELLEEYKWALRVYRIMFWLVVTCCLVLIMIDITSAQETNSTIIINNYTYYNITVYNITIFNTTQNSTFVINNYTDYNNYTNVYNSYNITNITYANYTVNFTGYYNKSEVDIKFDNYLRKADFPALVNITNSTESEWRNYDTMLGGSLFIAIIISIVAIVIAIRGGLE